MNGVNELTNEIIGTAIEVHCTLGSGLPWSRRMKDACCTSWLSASCTPNARIEPIHEAQLLPYLKLFGRRIGLLINCNVKQLTMGIRCLVHELPE